MFIDTHTHMISRTTDDYERMAAAGIVACIEPAFWLGQPRTSVGSYVDYLSTIVGWERFRAEQFGIRHFCTIGLNSKEANDQALAEAVMEVLPDFAVKEGVVAIGEIGYDEQTALEDRYFRLQLDLAAQLELPVLVHTPHRDKKRGTLRSMDVVAEHKLDPSLVIIDHNNEETAGAVLDRGYWTAFSIYPHTKMSGDRMVEIVRRYGAERILVDSACDWGISDPLAVPRTASRMREAGLAEDSIRAVTYGNALLAFGRTGDLREESWAGAGTSGASALFNGNSIQRGERTAAPAGERATDPVI